MAISAFGEGLLRSQQVSNEREELRLRAEELRAGFAEARTKALQQSSERFQTAISTAATNFRTNPTPDNKQTLDALVKTQQILMRENPDFASSQVPAETTAQLALGAPAPDAGPQVERLADVAMKLLESGADPMEIRNVVQTMASSNPALQTAAEAINTTLPESAKAFAERRGGMEIAEKQPIIDTLIRAGVPGQLATALVLGRAGASIQFGTEQPGTLTEPELRDVRQDIRGQDLVVGTVDRILPRIDEDTVGIWGAIAENIGGFTAQIPGLRQVGNMLGRLGLPVDEATVRKALEARNDFRLAVEQLKQLVEKGDRNILTNQDRVFVQQLSAVLDTRQDAQTIKRTLQNIRRITEKLRQGNIQILQNRRIPLAEPTEEEGEDQGESVTVTTPGGESFSFKPVTK